MSRWRGLVFLVAAATGAAALLWWTDEATRERIEANELEQRLAALRAVLPDGAYDNEPHLDSVLVTDTALLGDAGPLPVYRARLGGEPVAAVLTAVAPNGYSGRIYLLVGIDVDGEVIAVRVTAHSETPGLGDRIEADKTDWIYSFDGMRIDDPMSPTWMLTKDGGRFDRITGATITSHAVLGAVRNAVIYFDTYGSALFADEE